MSILGGTKRIYGLSPQTRCSMLESAGVVPKYLLNLEAEITTAFAETKLTSFLGNYSQTVAVKPSWSRSGTFFSFGNMHQTFPFVFCDHALVTPILYITSLLGLTFFLVAWWWSLAKLTYFYYTNRKSFSFTVKPLEKRNWEPTPKQKKDIKSLVSEMKLFSSAEQETVANHIEMALYLQYTGQVEEAQLYLVTNVLEFTNYMKDPNVLFAIFPSLPWNLCTLKLLSMLNQGVYDFEKVSSATRIDDPAIKMLVARLESLGCSMDTYKTNLDLLKKTADPERFFRILDMVTTQKFTIKQMNSLGHEYILFIRDVKPIVEARFFFFKRRASTQIEQEALQILENRMKFFFINTQKFFSRYGIDIFSPDLTKAEMATLHSFNTLLRYPSTERAIYFEGLLGLIRFSTFSSFAQMGCTEEIAEHLDSLPPVKTILELLGLEKTLNPLPSTKAMPSKFISFPQFIQELDRLKQKLSNQPQQSAAIYLFNKYYGYIDFETNVIFTGSLQKIKELQFFEKTLKMELLRASLPFNMAMPLKFVEHPALSEFTLTGVSNNLKLFDDRANVIDNIPSMKAYDAEIARSLSQKYTREALRERLENRKYPLPVACWNYAATNEEKFIAKSAVVTSILAGRGINKENIAAMAVTPLLNTLPTSFTE